MVAAWAPRPCANAGWTSPAIKTTIIVDAFRIGASCYHQDQDTLFLCAVRLRGMLTRCCCHLPVLGQIRGTSVEQAAILIRCLQRGSLHTLGQGSRSITNPYSWPGTARPKCPTVYRLLDLSFGSFGLSGKIANLEPN